MTTDQPDDANPYRSPETAETLESSIAPGRRYLSGKRRVMAWMIALFSLIGCLDFFADDRGLQRVLSLAVGILFGALCVRWCHYDRLERGGRSWKYLAATMVLCPGPLIVFPVYLLATRGLPRGIIAILGASAFLVVLLGAYLSVVFTLVILSEVI